jgi:serine/threonine-protein kinase
VGTWLRDKYRLDAVIGVGGMATVYRGAHRNGNRVAVKVLHTELSLSTDVRTRFLKEGYVANAVDHPGVVRVLDDDVTSDGAVFLVMELLEGDTLDTHWRNHDCRLPPQDVAAYAVQILEVLAAAHAKGIIHRDIKPENLFLTTDGVVKVLDFGIARMRDGAGVVTRTGRMMGTPAYMPREQALGLINEIDPRTDLWALGATMFALIAGRHVHVGETPETMVVHSATRPAESLATVAPEVPPALVAVVDRALSFHREERHADATAMIAALEAAQLTAYGISAPRRSVPRSASSSEAMQDTVKAPDPEARAPTAVAATEPAGAAPAAPTQGAAAHEGAAPPPSTPARVAPEVATTLPARVSTTSGVSSQQPRALPVSDAPPTSGARSSRAKLVVAVVATLTVVGVVAAGSRGLGGSTAATSGTRLVPSEQVGIATAAPLASAAPAPSVTVLADDASAPSAAPAVSARPAPSAKREAGAAPVKPAAPDCNPPIYYDPVTGQKKVKPGC